MWNDVLLIEGFAIAGGSPWLCQTAEQSNASQCLRECCFAGLSRA
jgi:hypothetical protein